MEQHFTLGTVPSALYNTYLFILCDDKRLIQYKYFLNVFFHSDSDSDWEPPVPSCPLYLCPQWCSYATVHYCRHASASGPKGHSMEASLCSVSNEMHHLFSLPLLYIRKRLLWDMAQAAKYCDEDFQWGYCFFFLIFIF